MKSSIPIIRLNKETTFSGGRIRKMQKILQGGGEGKAIIKNGKIAFTFIPMMSLVCIPAQGWEASGW